MEPLNQAYLMKLLAVPVDEALEHTSPKERAEVPQELARPPGIQNLVEWGQLQAPAGKHEGRTFAELYDNQSGYVNQMWNRKSVSSWVRSFQLYCRLRRDASRERFAMEQQLPMIPKPPAQSKSAPVQKDGECVQVHVSQGTVGEIHIKRGGPTKVNLMSASSKREPPNQLHVQIAIQVQEAKQEPDEQ